MVHTEIYSDGIMIEKTTIITSEGKWYEIGLPTGLYLKRIYWVVGKNEQEALDILADFLEKNNMSGLYKTFDELFDEAEEEGESFEEYEQNYICCGNHGIYLDAMVQIRQLEKGEKTL